MSLEIEIVPSVLGIGLNAAPEIEIAESSMLVALVSPGTECEFTFSTTQVLVDAAPEVTLGVQAIEVSLLGEGPQGPPGPANLVISPSDPGARPFPFLWVKPIGDPPSDLSLVLRSP